MPLLKSSNICGTTQTFLISVRFVVSPPKLKPVDLQATAKIEIALIANNVFVNFIIEILETKYPQCLLEVLISM